MAWFIIDPYLFNGYLPRILERFLNEMTFSMIYGVYATILYIWYSLTENIFKKYQLEEEEMIKYQKIDENAQENVKRRFKRFPKFVLYFKHVYHYFVL